MSALRQAQLVTTSADMTSQQDHQHGACVAAQHLRRILQALTFGAPMEVEEAEWLAVGLRRYLDAAPTGLDLSRQHSDCPSRQVVHRGGGPNVSQSGTPPSAR